MHKVTVITFTFTAFVIDTFVLLVYVHCLSVLRFLLQSSYSIGSTDMCIVHFRV